MASGDTISDAKASSRDGPMTGKEDRASYPTPEAERACLSDDDILAESTAEAEAKPIKRTKRKARAQKETEEPSTPSRVDENKPPLGRRVFSANDVSTPQAASSMSPACHWSDRGPYIGSGSPEMGSFWGALSSPEAPTPTRRASLGMMRVSRDSYSSRRARRRQLVAIAQPLADFLDDTDAQR